MSATCATCALFSVKVRWSDKPAEGACYGWIDSHYDENGHVTHRTGERRWTRETDTCERHEVDDRIRVTPR